MGIGANYWVCTESEMISQETLQLFIVKKNDYSTRDVNFEYSS